MTKPVTPGEKQEDGLISAVLDLEQNPHVSFRPGPVSPAILLLCSTTGLWLCN